jgi:hypothetical protein
MDKLIGFPTHERNTFCKEKKNSNREVLLKIMTHLMLTSMFSSQLDLP